MRISLKKSKQRKGNINIQKGAKKAAETRKRHKAEQEALFDKMFTIARSECDLFGNKYTDEERKEAEKYIRENFKKRNKK